MTATTGNFAISLAILAAMGAVLASLAAARFESDRFLGAARWLIGAFGALLTVAIAALTAASVNSDFSIEYVAHYTERALPLGYKLAAVWAGQEGSILLWAWLLAVMSVLFVATRRDLKGSEGAAVIATVAVICGFFAALMLFAANPFKLIEIVPADGRGLNPLLQDPAMIAHPPILFLGYAGFTMPFALLVGALVAARKDNLWIAGTRRWVIASWLFLTAGILLGAQWAYIELGWGGYWAWDPVENASLFPWLTGTALLHSIMAQQHRGMFKKWNASLIALSFLLCLFGTYLTRSGIIQSVHAFQESPIGNFFLAFIVATALVTTVLIVVRRRELAGERELSGLVGREGAFLATNVLLVGMLVVTLVGTLFPVISRTIGDREVTVGPAFYNKVVAPIGMLLVALMAVGPMLTYGDGAARRLVRGAIGPVLFAAVAVIVAAVFQQIRSAWALAAVAIVACGVACLLADLVKSLIARVREGENPVAALVRLLDSNHRRYGGQLAHLGMLLVIAGMVGSSVYGTKQDFQLTPGQTVSFGGQTLQFKQLIETRHANYTAVGAEVAFTAVDGTVTTLRPQRRFYDKSEQPNSEVALEMGWKRDVYLTLAGWEKGGEVTAIQVIVNPLVSWIWAGGVVMSLGAILALLPRLIPQAAPAPAPATAGAAAASKTGRRRRERLSLTAST
jgi:cytochrome c-type biogenesis protein CcmF